MIKNKKTVPLYEWAPNHFSWFLVGNIELSIKLEEIPIGGDSETHYHDRSCQIFFVLEGQSIIKIDDQQYFLKKYDGIEIPVQKRHQIINNGKEKLQFILISVPKVQEDDVYRKK